MNKICWLCFLALCVGCSSSQPQFDRKQKYAIQLCREQFKPLKKQLESHLKKGDLKKSALLFGKMERYAFEMWAARIPRYNPENLTSFQEYGKRLQRLAREGRKIAEGANLYQAKKIFKKVKRNCLGCHSQYKFDF